MLNLSFNEVTDISPLVKNHWIDKGVSVLIDNNHLDLTPGSSNMKDINTLLDRGVRLEYTPQRSP